MSVATHPALGADATGGVSALATGAGGDVEHAAAAADPGAVEHGLGRLAEPRRPATGSQRSHASAASSHCCRVVVLVLLRIEVHGVLLVSKCPHPEGARSGA